MLWFIGSVLFILATLFWLPLQLEIETGHGVYKVEWGGILSIRAVPGEERWRWFYTVLFWAKEWVPSNTRRVIKKPKTKRRKPPMSPKNALALAGNLFWAIKIKRFRLDWDTGDFVRNAQLYPFFHALSNRKWQLAINFSGKEELAILLQTRLWHLFTAILRSFFQPK
jgi:hypothetical protein